MKLIPKLRLGDEFKTEKPKEDPFTETVGETFYAFTRRELTWLCRNCETENDMERHSCRVCGFARE